ncbi:MAG: tRNA (adenosine(37)-N6)-dimethylallyltransferase MiaA [Gammaproteobacteria bacterium]|jgi:tRNA dimethylallyltransferase|nr:tRNA (adenosine(37)-N6)-dimethylallyltransferase MiaA [Gammaproteobacteria bacterium]
MGPTAAGKSALALALAARLAAMGQPCEIISVDSAQVYRGMDIGTAKPSAAERRQVPHHLLDICAITDTYSAGRFVADAAALLTRLSAAGVLPLLTGGTMLYFLALQRGLAELPSADAGLRAELDARAARLGWPALHAELAQVDPRTAERLRPTDAQRIQRALEVYKLTGMPLADLQSATAPVVESDYLNIGLLPNDRAALHARIDQRLQAMLAAGFVAEVRALLQQPAVTAATPALRAVGYRQLIPHVLYGEDLESAVTHAATATRRLAKRQLTWLRSWPDLHRFDPRQAGCSDALMQRVSDWLAGEPRSGAQFVQRLS